jgi:hypothetical protein
MPLPSPNWSPGMSRTDRSIRKRSINSIDLMGRLYLQYMMAPDSFVVTIPLGRMLSFFKLRILPHEEFSAAMVYSTVNRKVSPFVIELLVCIVPKC